LRLQKLQNQSFKNEEKKQKFKILLKSFLFLEILETFLCNLLIFMFIFAIMF